ncbi:MAG: hypothetical protein ACRD3L_16385 [Terriglobales bacterium]
MKLQGINDFSKSPSVVNQTRFDGMRDEPAFNEDFRFWEAWERFHSLKTDRM